jgi:hypothetical protein
MEAANLGARAASLDAAALDTALDRLATVPSYVPSVEAWALPAFAKYFRNALREDTLLRVCDGGIVFLPGAAGTVQEIFQDACENFYAEPDRRTPMVLVGREYWTRTCPAWPLLRSLADAGGFAGGAVLVDSWSDAAAVLLG